MNIETLPPDSESTKHTRWLKELRWVLLFFCLSGILFFRVLIQNQEVLGLKYSDTMELFFYFRSFGFDYLKRGILPLWNPYVFSGYPFLANMGSALLYPLNALYLFLTVPVAMNWSLALHVTLAATAMYCFLRRINLEPIAALGGACIFTLNGTTAGWILGGYLTCINGFVWIPFIFLGADIGIRDQRWSGWIGAGCALALQIFAGYPQFPWIVTVGVGVYSVLRIAITTQNGSKLWQIVKAFIGILCMCAVACAVSAVQLLPGIEFVFHSVRGGVRLSEFALMHAYPLENMISWLIPHCYGDAWNKLPYWGRWFFWEVLPFIGITSLCLAWVGRVLHRRRRETLIFLLFALIFLIFSFGGQIPVLKWLYYSIPLAGLFRGPGRFLVIVNFAAACLAGFGLDALIHCIDSAVQERRLRYIAWALGVLTVICALFFFIWLSSGRFISWWVGYVGGELKKPNHFLKMLPESMSVFLGQSFLVMRAGFKRMLMWLALATGTFFCFGVKRLRRAIPGVLCLLIMIELGTFFYGSMARWNTKDIEWPDSLIAFLKEETKEGYRISFYPRDGVGGLNRNVFYRIPAASGFDSNIFKRYNRFIARSQALPEKDRSYFTMGLYRYDPLLDFLSLKNMVFSNDEVSGDQISKTPVFKTGEFTVYRNDNVLPRVSLVAEARLMDQEDIFTLLSERTGGQASAVLFETPCEETYEPAGKTTALTVLSFSEENPNKVDMRVDIQREGFLVLRDMYYPGWIATIDGAPGKIYRADYLFRAIRVPKGVHRVVFSYEPLSVKIGACISLGSVIFLFVWYLRRCHFAVKGQVKQRILRT